MRHTLAVLFAITTIAATAHAQWTLHDAHTTADLRGIDNVGGGVAWASGSDGTILRTEDAGIVWQLCAKPPGGEHLDFRAIQAFDNNTAIIMSSGKGDLSRLYKTTDGCQSWKLLFTNPDKDGFWDALKFSSPNHGFLLGDPVLSQGDKAPHFFLSETEDGGATWHSWHERTEALQAHDGAGVFAASNSSLLLSGNQMIFGTGGLDGSRIVSLGPGVCGTNGGKVTSCIGTRVYYLVQANRAASSGIFSIGSRGAGPEEIVAVGGDYSQPESGIKNAWTTAFHRPPTSLDKFGFESATTPPHGFRSAVAFDSKSKTWITVGPNGTDISTDDGRNWRALKPDPAFNDTPDADQHWNALSLPFAVGPHGRIGTLRPSALSPGK